MTTEASASGGFWRWGAPLAAGAGALAAAALAAASLWGTGTISLPWTAERLIDAAVAATAFSATLTACWACLVARRHGADSSLPATPQGRQTPRAFLAAATIGACVALAAYWLDLGLKLDELITITSYATQPLAVAASKYNAPNNHVLHTLLVWVAHQLGGWNVVVLRLPAFLSFCLLLPALWWFVRREYGATAAAFATLFAGTSPFLVNFAIYARGYTLLLLFFTVALLCGQRLVEAPKRTAVWATWATAIALGLYALPLMAYPAAAAGAWMLLARWRRCGRRQLGPFLARTAAWSVAALALAFVLYLPVFAAEGVTGPYDAIVRSCYQCAVPPLALADPLVLWHRWQLPVPAWAQGALLALVVVGVAGGRGRSCGRTGTLLLATGLAWGLLFASHPVLLPPRLAIWVLLVCLILAGVGAAVAFEGALAQAARWRRVASPSSRLLLECASVGLLFCILSRWTVSGMHAGRGSYDGWITNLVRELQMRPGDHFSACRAARGTILFVRHFHTVEADVSPHRPFAWPTTHASVHRVSSSREDHHADRRSHALDGPSQRQGRLFLFDYYVPAPGDEVSLCSSLSLAPEQVGTEWLHDHEQVAAFSEGKVYVLHDWTRSR